MAGIYLLLSLAILLTCCLAFRLHVLTLQIQDLNFEAHSLKEEIYDLRNEEE